MDPSECVSFDEDTGEETLDDDVEMTDVKLSENGGFWEADSVLLNASEETGSGGEGNMRDNAMKKSRRKLRKRKRKSKGSPTFNITYINRFVLDTCRRFNERKSYLVWNAVGCLGFSTMMDLVKEVDVIQHCGGQKTANGMEFRKGGGILWNIIKNRDPKAFKEIMAKGKELENQIFRQHKNKHSSPAISQAQNFPHGASEHSMSNSFDKLPFCQNHETSTPHKRRLSVLDRIRVPVSYEDLHEEGEIVPVDCDDLLEEVKISEP